MSKKLPRNFQILRGDELIQAMELKRREGRYSVKEAIEILEDQHQTGERFPVAQAVWVGDLPYYMQGQCQEERNEGNQLEDWKDWPIYNDHTEVYWDDLNAWLEKHTRVKYRFPNPSAAPVERASDDPTAPAWSLKRPKRFQGYGKPLYDLLKAAHAAGQPKPSARDVLDTWKVKPPTDVVEVTDNGLKYYDAQGNTKPADLEAIRKAIDRMTR